MGFDLNALKKPRLNGVKKYTKNGSYTVAYSKLRRERDLYYQNNGVSWRNILEELVPLVEKDLSSSKIAEWNTISGLYYNDGIKYDRAIANLMAERLEVIVKNPFLANREELKRFIKFAKNSGGFQVN
tara:strand:- start:15 stop:398 length:384 start_codon:yes stop_codon:yes gene_type:complete